MPHRFKGFSGDVEDGLDNSGKLAKATVPKKDERQQEKKRNGVQWENM